MTQAMLSVRNLTTSFRDGDVWRPVLRDISFDVKPREAVAIVGESGSGKSVTALSIMRLLDRRTARLEGAIELGGESILALSEAQMRAVRGSRVAMIFQEPMTSLNPVMTVGDQIAEGVRQHRGLQGEAAQKEAGRLLDKVRIPAAAARLRDYPHNFSGGMRQRVMIAMALAGGPELLIADEPTTALDVTVQAQILDLIRSLQQEDGMSVLFITHDMGVVAEIAERTVVMFRGDIVETGDTVQLFARPAQAYTRALLAAVPRLGAKTEEAGPMRFATSARPMSPVLDVRNLSVRFDVRSGLFGRVRGRVHAVENVSFSVGAGETLSLVGESGCGKSTTGRSILRLVEPQTGEILLEGEDLRGMNAAALRQRRRGLQMIFQDPFASLNPKMRVGLSIMEPLLIHRLAGKVEARVKAQELLECVGLQAAMMERFPHEFSGGERQRICIARALALSPKLIVADESVSALDVTIKAQVVNLLLDLQERLGLAYLFISHDMAVVERVSHRVAVMYMGEIVEIGPRAGVFGNPRHPYTRKLLAAVPVADPSHRRRKPMPAENDLHSPLRSLEHQAPPRRYVEVGPDHLILVSPDAA